MTTRLPANTAEELAITDLPANTAKGTVMTGLRVKKEADRQHSLETVWEAMKSQALLLMWISTNVNESIRS